MRFPNLASQERINEQGCLMYTIAAHPTRYNGVQFRSRLEARWAAYFDLCGLKWDYEPVDFRGWSPDFSIETPFGKLFVEVKPCDDSDHPAFDKALAHGKQVQVLLLGLDPTVGTVAIPHGQSHSADELAEFFLSRNNEQLSRAARALLWREAGNRTQWRPA